MKQLLSVLLALVSLLSLSFILVPGILWWLSPGDFAWRDELTAVLTLLALEKIWAMFFRLRERYSASVAKDWTAVSVGASYTAVWYGSAFEFYARRGAGVTPALIGGAVALYVAAVALRHWAFFYLGHQWAVHLDEVIPDRKLITGGPYRFARHPIYTSAVLEVLGVSLLLGAWGSFLFAAVVFLPLEVQRAYFEERFSRRIFGAAYDQYAARTWAFAPFWRKQRSPDSAG